MIFCKAYALIYLNTDVLTHLALRLECSRYTRSVPWLLMFWLLLSPGHQQPWCWLYWMSRSLSLPGLNNSIGPIARNCSKWLSGNRICGPKLPAKLVFWKFWQQTFFCIKHQLTVHPMRSWFWEVICKVTIKVNQFLFVISMISSPLYSIWLYDQLGITPWFELSMT